MRKIIISLFLFVVMALPNKAMALSVTTTNDGSVLAGTILGGGVTITPGSISYSGAAGASGTFTDGVSSGLGIESGIILTSGSAASAVGPNVNDATTTINSLGGDADLNGLIPGYTTYDATLLEFDFTTTGGDLYFNYVFASEEYNEWVNSSFNDVFGFFLNGTNIALIPSTSTPVAIDNVNTAVNPAYYNNNDPSDTATPFDIEYDGFTTVFTAMALGLGSGSHHIKLAIADAGDHSLDSAVFLQAGSFSDEPTNGVPEPSTLLLMGSGMAGLALFRRKFPAQR